MKTNIKENLSIQVGIVFGNPKIECARFGICEINMIKDANTICKGVQRAQGELMNINNKNLALVFRKQDLDPALIEKYLSNRYFIIEVDTELPIEITNALEMKTHTIVKGKYPLFSAFNEVLIIFDPEKIVG